MRASISLSRSLMVPALVAATASLVAAMSAGASGGAQLDRAVLSDPTRPAEDREQDADRHPLQVYEVFGVAPGMTVADVFAAKGYNTHLLSRLVGDSGKVLAIMGLYGDPEFAGGRVYEGDTMAARIESAGLTNVTMLRETADAEAGSVDVAIIIRNYHDVEWLDTTRTRKDTVAGLYALVKPGGIVGIVEVATPHPGWHQETHRLNKQVVIDDFTAGGFELAGESDLLASTEDDHTTSGFEQGRFKMDRYVLKFRRPTM